MNVNVELQNVWFDIRLDCHHCEKTGKVRVLSADTTFRLECCGWCKGVGHIMKSICASQLKEMLGEKR